MSHELTEPTITKLGSGKAKARIHASELFSQEEAESTLQGSPDTVRLSCAGAIMMNTANAFTSNYLHLERRYNAELHEPSKLMNCTRRSKREPTRRVPGAIPSPASVPSSRIGSSLAPWLHALNEPRVGRKQRREKHAAGAAAHTPGSHMGLTLGI